MSAAADANAALIDRFYRAFATKDAATMAACYHREARFSDPVFPDLDYEHVTSMWRMFCRPGGGEILIEHSNVRADEATGSAHWDARYRFPATKRPVLNRIDASFEFKEGLIWRHRDSFAFWRWTRMALGPAGVLLGWSPIVRNAVRREARKSLDAFIAQSAPSSRA